MVNTSIPACTIYHSYLQVADCLFATPHAVSHAPCSLVSLLSWKFRKMLFSFPLQLSCPPPPPCTHESFAPLSHRLIYKLSPFPLTHPCFVSNQRSPPFFTEQLQRLRIVCNYRDCVQFQTLNINVPVYECQIMSLNIQCTLSMY